MPRFLPLFLPVLLIAFLAVERPPLGRFQKEASPSRAGQPQMVGRANPKNQRPLRQSRRISSRFILEQLEAELLDGLTAVDRADLASYLDILSRPAGRGMSWCWSEDTSERKVAAFGAAEQLARRGVSLAPLAFRFLDAERWDETATDGAGGRQGDPVTLTWSVVPDGTLVPGNSGDANRGSDLRGWLAEIYGGSRTGPVEEEAWFALFEEAFSAMGSTCGVEFRFEAHDDGAPVGSGISGVLGVRGDIRIGARSLDGTGGLLGISLGPDEGDMVLDSGDALLSLTGSDSLRLFNTLTHEIGHCLGLAHVCPVDQTKLMEPNLATSFRGPQFDEFQSLQRLYGDPLERHGAHRDNDSVLSATPLALSAGSELSLPRLSIDDNGDEDFFRLDLLNGQRLLAEVIPGEGVYLEGGESSHGCGPGELFDSARVHDLKVEILDRDGETVLESADRFGPGGREKTAVFEVPREGGYFLKVFGGITDAAQLYELRLRLEEQVPGPHLVFDEAEVVAESGALKNDRPDPGETVRVRVPLSNEGLDAGENLSLAVTVSEKVTLFAGSAPPALAPGERGFVDLVFAVAGECGEQAGVEMAISNEAGILVTRDFVFDLGEVLSPVPLAEEFDAAASLPTGWESSQLGAGGIWTTSTARWATPLRSVFAGGSSAAGESILLSPPVVLGNKGGILSFRHLYRTEVGYDGGVLEVSRDGGAWIDLINGYNLEVKGGYERTVSGAFGSSLGGRQAWTGRLSSFIETTVALPSSWGGESLRFRWRLAHDQSGASEGWWVDSVRLEMVIDDCVPHRPELSLRLVSGGLNENLPSREAVLSLQSALPLLAEVPLVLQATGSAGSTDFSGDLAVVFPARSTEMTFSLRVRPDDLKEGEEQLVLRIPDGESGFAPGAPAEVLLPVTDRITLVEWSTTGFGIAVDLFGDQDGDGLSGLGEYLLGTNPLSASSGQKLVPELRNGGVLLPTGPLPVRDDAILGVEASENLRDWQPVSFVLVDEGILITSMGDGSFVRLTFSRSD